MYRADVLAPVSLLIARGLTPAAKVLWLAIRTHEEPVPQATLATSSALSQPTIRKSLAQLKACGWYSASTGKICPPDSSAEVCIPCSLVSETRVRPQAKLLYGILQTVPTFHDQSGKFTYITLAAAAYLSSDTVKASIRELTATGWLQTSQANQLAPIRYTLRIPERDRSAAEVARAVRRLEEADYRGEALMREYLSLIIDSDEFGDNARPGFLTNPLTDELMELDRYYAPVMAFEFQGPQHFRTTGRYSSEQILATQKARDLMKEALCARRGVHLVVVNREDLSLETMRRKVGTLLPLRDLSSHGELIRLLERASKHYRS